MFDEKVRRESHEGGPFGLGTPLAITSVSLSASRAAIFGNFGRLSAYHKAVDAALQESMTSVLDVPGQCR